MMSECEASAMCGILSIKICVKRRKSNKGGESERRWVVVIIQCLDSGG